MTSFRTCAGCASKDQEGGCDHLFNLKTHISGLGITLVNHRCAHRQDKFLPGDAVTVTTYPSLVSDEDGLPPQQRFPAIFISRHGTKAICFVRPGTRGSGGWDFEPKEGNKGFVKVTLSRVRAREGVPRAIMTSCERCGEIPSLTGCPASDYTGPYDTGGRCLAKKIQEDVAA
jgi:hypothetical protein